MDRFASIQTFVQVAQLGSFAGAARRLNMTPAMATNHVQALEQRLGVRLLNRTTRKVALTEEGAGFYERCARILSDMAEAESVARARQSTPSGTVRLNTDVALARVLSPIIADYTSVYADVSFELIMTDHMVDMIEEQFDLAIRAGELRDSNYLIRRSLGVGRFALCAAPRYLARCGTPRHPKDLAAHNCLNVAHPARDDQWHFAGADGAHAITVAGNLRSNSVEALRVATVAGQGLCLLPLLSVADDLAAGRLVTLLPEYTTADALVHAIYHAGGHMPVKLRSFLDFVIARLRTGSPDPARAAPVKGDAEILRSAPRRRAAARSGAAPERIETFLSGRVRAGHATIMA
jgi:DNA-binding transcriptional LysR family regulator